MNKTKTIKLEKLADIRTGLSLREAIKPVENGNAFILQIKDIQDDNEIDYSRITQTTLKTIKAKRMLHRGDILLRARGVNRSAALFDGQGKNYQAANQFLIIRVTEDELLPEYLQWYLNQKPAQQYLAENSTGTSIPYTQASTLANLGIIVPSRQKQRAIAQLQKLSRDEEHVIQQIIVNRKQMMNAIVYDLMKQSKTTKQQTQQTQQT